MPPVGWQAPSLKSIVYSAVGSCFSAIESTAGVQRKADVDQRAGFDNITSVDQKTFTVSAAARKCDARQNEQISIIRRCFADKALPRDTEVDCLSDVGIGKHYLKGQPK